MVSLDKHDEECPFGTNNTFLFACTNIHIFSSLNYDKLHK